VRGARSSNLAGVKLLGRKNDDSDEARESDSAAASAPEPSTAAPAGTTAPKGRPTPKRNTTAKRRGPVAPAPTTAAEARQRRKELRSTMTKEERKAAKAKDRSNMAARRERMMAGEEAFLLARDQGPVRRYARDIVDSRRNVLGLFMPLALGLVLVSMVVPRLQLFVSPAMLAMMLLMFADAFLLGRKVNRAVDEKFPENTETNWKLGLYAASRASQIRRLRAPRPQVTLGTKVL